MTLEESTAWSLAAVEAGDLDGLTRAIHARKEAIGAGLNKNAAGIALAIEAGDQLYGALEALKRDLNLESARLQRIQNGYSRERAGATQISLHG